jgi:hypothetical protein
VVLSANLNPDDPDGYLLAIPKNNHVPKEKRRSIAYELVPSEYDPEIGRVAWGATVDVSATDILRALADKEKDGGEKTSAAKAFLLSSLASGDWILAKALFTAAEEQGISERTLKRAKERLPITSEKKGDVWCWRLQKQPSVLNE